MRYTVSIFTLLILFWLGNSGHYSTLLLAMGFLSTGFVVAVVRRMNVVDHESQPLHMLTWKLLSYYGWLFVQILRSNVDVVYRIWRGNDVLSPTVASLTMMQESDIGKVIFANSITLTPGTVAMDLENNRVLIHALTRNSIDELQGGDMNRRVAQLEGRN
ncbi:MAG: cation transporter [Porticoccaceae bacterium]|nr:cation transporter [Porticoccaceae bacterium]